ncbi:hypothetical protein QFZ22_006176 [Streptomyces canus]|uniref:Secreted protein n=1 Tax=Streptomyces canus TaxID=58343 RepID=A0AAW8FJ92_9ACTN|nr:hypothetical protein [Streptomyces canus]MDQ0910191.1 hypothetical protein [Streptomyces canus]
MSQQPVPVPKKPLSRGKKIAIGVGVLIAAPPFIAGMVSGVKDSATQDTSAAATTPAASHSSPMGKPSTKTKRTLATHVSTTGPAQKLADLDGNGRPASEYQQVLDALAPRCTEDRPRLTAVVNATLEDLKENSVNDEDEFSVLQHLEQSVPAGDPRINCTSVAEDYATLREGN